MVSVEDSEGHVVEVSGLHSIPFNNIIALQRMSERDKKGARNFNRTSLANLHTNEPRLLRAYKTHSARMCAIARRLEKSDLCVRS